MDLTREREILSPRLHFPPQSWWNKVFHAFDVAVDDPRARRRGIRRPTSDHSWIDDELSLIGSKAKGNTTLSASFSSPGEDRSGENKRERERGKRKRRTGGVGKQLREGEERTALYDNAL